MNLRDKEHEQIIEKAGQLGYENELKYFGCSQAVVSALIEALGIGGQDILGSSTALAGGIARREKCVVRLLEGL
jgi:hypothetical protein